MLAPQLFFNSSADACAASILAILSAIVQAQLKYCRSGMIVFQSNVIKVKKKTFTRYIGIARIFDLRGGPNRKSHAMTLSKIFEKMVFLWDKDIVKWRNKSRGLVWHVAWILQKEKENFSEIVLVVRHVEQTCLTQKCHRLCNGGPAAGQMFVIFGGKITFSIPLGSYFARF